MFRTSSLSRNHRLLRDCAHTWSTASRCFRPGLDVLEDRTLPSTFTVVNTDDSSPGSLRDAIQQANTNPGPDLITFTKRVRGEITLTSGELNITDDLTLEGPGALRLAVSGNDSSRIFNISGSIEASISALTITKGVAPVGGGIANYGGQLSLDQVVLDGNRAQGGTGPNSNGGALYNDTRATLEISHSIFVHNKAIGAAGTSTVNGQTTFGGAVENLGQAVITHSTFLDNAVLSGDSGPGTRAGNAGGGAIANRQGADLTLTDSFFAGNQSLAGHKLSSLPGQPNGNSSGGALINNFGATASIARTQFISNRAVGGDGTTYGVLGGFAIGGAVATFFFGANVSIDQSSFLLNEAIGGASGPGASGAGASGGAIVAQGGPAPGIPAFLTVTNSVVTGNRAVGGLGGSGAAGGLGEGGGVSSTFGAMTTIDGSWVLSNVAQGGRGGDDGDGGVGQGGGFVNGSFPPFLPTSLLVTDSTIAGNTALGGAAGAGGNGGDAFAGGFYHEGPVDSVLRKVVIASNFVLGGTGVIGGSAFGSGVAAVPSPFASAVGGGSVTLEDASIRHNQALKGQGSLTDGEGIGGGLYVVEALVTLVDATVENNNASTAFDDVFGPVFFP